MKLGTCASCAAPIYWVSTAAGKWMPIDRQPRDDGNVYVDEHDVAHVQRRTTEGQVALGFDSARRYVSHFVSCPHADQHRKGRS